MSAIPRPRPDRDGRPPARPGSLKPVPPIVPQLMARSEALSSDAPTPPFVERRRRPRGVLARLMRGSLPLEGAAARAEEASRALARWRWPALIVLGVALAGVGIGAWWRNRAPELHARYRAEALCFALAGRPAFAPPMSVETSAAMVRGRFGAQTPASLAIRSTMRIRDDMVLTERHRHVGDFDVSILWLRLPTAGGGHHWLVVGWMEDSDLAMCSFRFAGDPTELSSEQLMWGDRLLSRILDPRYFHDGALPDVRWRATRNDALPRFGPPAPASD